MFQLSKSSVGRETLMSVLYNQRATGHFAAVTQREIHYSRLDTVPPFSTFTSLSINQNAMQPLHRAFWVMAPYTLYNNNNLMGSMHVAPHKESVLQSVSDHTVSIFGIWDCTMNAWWIVPLQCDYVSSRQLTASIGAAYHFWNTAKQTNKKKQTNRLWT